ncbi:response regulator receiver protein [Solidesulfovibrio fructosivorans JJ]]|uniref:Response regulator receiver protein n=1 Tax=Solidesulfovibrio fructosivorans JJ] TaxID=596151 RepID=E1JU18_SOLFR|nr:response regulator [Solidesulfovibrio fructosivorans]EFL51948.1 response regulator receiver protein [Solidesulfovibrio fructosivorans JJ]]
MPHKRILTVDDAKSVRGLVSQTLRQAGYDIAEAVDGADALEKASEGIDMVITDLNMPGMGGLELITRLRERADTRFTPILVLTTESQSDTRRRAVSAGASGWIVKPFAPEVLLALVRRFLC